MGVKYSKKAFREALLEAAAETAGDLTNTFFRVVSDEAPVENGHLHQTFAAGLKQANVPEADDAMYSLLSKGSGDAEADSRGSGKMLVSKTGVTITVETSVGFVNVLNDGGLQVPDVGGATGFKVGGTSTEGELYAPRKDDGPVGFLMWTEGGGKHFSQMHTWGPLGFFESAAMSVETQAQSMGLK